EGVDSGLFESLRKLRTSIASERGVPAYLLFSDATLREMARDRPESPAALLRVRGVGERKLADLGQRFVHCIVEYCRSNGLAPATAAGGRKSRTAERPKDTK